MPSVTKAKPPRVLRDYDEEWGYIVLGTHDVDVAKALLIEFLDEPEQHRWSAWAAKDIVMGCGPPESTWIRRTFGYEQWAWQIQHTAPNAPGASKAVEWRH